MQKLTAILERTFGIIHKRISKGSIVVPLGKIAERSGMHSSMQILVRSIFRVRRTA